MSLSANTAPVPDPGRVAQVGQDINTAAAKQSQIGSMVSQYNPYGSLQYASDPTSPSGYKATTTLTPAQQDLLTTLQGSQKKGGAAGGSMLDYYTGNTDPTKAIGDKTSGLTQQIMGSYDAANNQRTKELIAQNDTALKNQGIFPGTPAYDKGMAGVIRGTEEARNSMLASIQPQAFQEASSLYQMPASLGGALAAFGQPGSVSQNLVQAPGLNIQPVDYAAISGNITNQNIQNAQLKNQYDTSMINALMSPFNAAMGGWGMGGFKGFSERRLKKNVKPIGRLDNGLTVYSFSYTWEQATNRIGMMADEVDKVHPEAVSEVNGFKVVDYELAIR